MAEFKAYLVRRHRTAAMNRQVHEMVAISVSKCDYTLNRRDDWNCSRNPRLVVEVRERPPRNPRGPQRRERQGTN